MRAPALNKRTVGENCSGTRNAPVQEERLYLAEEVNRFGFHNASGQVASISQAEIKTLGWFGKISTVTIIKKKKTAK